jgi:hypothetical protein
MSWTKDTAPRSGGVKGKVDRIPRSRGERAAANRKAWTCLLDTVQGKGVEMQFLRTDNPGRFQELKLRAADTILRYTQPPVVPDVPAVMMVRWLSSPPTDGPPARNGNGYAPMLELSRSDVAERPEPEGDDDAPPA